MLSTIKLPAGTPVVLVLIGINALIWLAQGASQGYVTQVGVLYGPEVRAGEWWRLIASGFLHANIFHIMFNMVLLYALGHQLEQSVGGARFLLIYAGALFGGSAAVMMFDWPQITLGASGAVMGVVSAFGIAIMTQGNDPRQSPVFGLVLINLALPLVIGGISFWAHFGGVVGGCLMAFLLIWWPAKKRSVSPNTLLINGCLLAVVLFVVAYKSALIGGIM